MTLTLDRVRLHTIVHHSSTSTYTQYCTEIEESFCGRTDGHSRPTLLGRLKKVDLKRLFKQKYLAVVNYQHNDVQG